MRSGDYTSAWDALGPSLYGFALKRQNAVVGAGGFTSAWDALGPYLYAFSLRGASLPHQLPASWAQSFSSVAHISIRAANLTGKGARRGDAGGCCCCGLPAASLGLPTSQARGALCGDAGGCCRPPSCPVLQRDGCIRRAWRASVAWGQMHLMPSPCLIPCLGSFRCLGLDGLHALTLTAGTFPNEWARLACSLTCRRSGWATTRS